MQNSSLKGTRSKWLLCHYIPVPYTQSNNAHKSLNERMDEWMNEWEWPTPPSHWCSEVCRLDIYISNQLQIKNICQKENCIQTKTFRSPSCHWFWDNTMTTYIAITLSEYCDVTLLVKETNKKKLCYQSLAQWATGFPGLACKEPEYLQGSCTIKITQASVRDHSRRLPSRSSLPSFQSTPCLISSNSCLPTELWCCVLWTSQLCERPDWALQTSLHKGVNT